MDKDVGRVLDRAAERAFRRYHDEEYGRSPALEARGKMTELVEAQRCALFSPVPRVARRTWWERFFAFVSGVFRDR